MSDYKPVLIYTLNKEYKQVPRMTDSIEMFRHEKPDSFLIEHSSGVPTEAMVENVVMPIIRISKWETTKKLDLEPIRLDTYIAVEPELLEVLEEKHKAELDIQYCNLNKVIGDVTKLYDEYSDRLIAFYKLPWYKRIWMALRNEI